MTERRTLPALLALLVALVASSCGGDSGTRSADPPVQPAQAEEPSTPTEPQQEPATEQEEVTAPPSLGDAERVIDLEVERSDGYRGLATLSVYAPFRADAVPTVPASSGPGACAADAQTDAVVPLSYLVTNTTNGFDADLRVELRDLVWSPPVTSIAFDTPWGECLEYHSGQGGVLLSAGWQQPIVPNTTNKGAMFVVLRNYYTPAHPDADDPQFGAKFSAALSINGNWPGELNDVVIGNWTGD